MSEPTAPADATTGTDSPTEAPSVQPHVVIITGLSGAGKTATSKLLEDFGYIVVDNLPAELLRELAELVVREPARFERLALVLDARSGDVPLAFGAALGALESRGVVPQVFFLEARDDVLIRRFSETRHRHPLDSDEQGVASSIERERELLTEVRAQSDVIIDTSDLSGRQLRERISASLSGAASSDPIGLQLISFGYKHGIPLEADLVFDVRFMENPFYIDRLRPHSGLTQPVRDFVLGQPVTQRFMEFIDEYLDFALPAYQSEGKSRLTVGIGCTGGFHRSVAITEAIADRRRDSGNGQVSVWHRELDRR